MFNLFGDGQQHNDDYSTTAMAAAAATKSTTASNRNARISSDTHFELAEEPFGAEISHNSTRTTTTTDAIHQSIIKRFNADAITTTCGQQYERELASSPTGQLAHATGFCGSSNANDTISGIELGFNTMEYNFSDIEPLWVRKDWPDILMRVSFVAPVVLLGIVGNLTIIWSICKFKSFRSKPTNIFILSMAIADLITALVCPLAALFTDIYQFYVMGSVLCRLEGSIKITCLLVSAYSLNWLSFIWLRYIVQPCRTRISIRQSWFILAGIWMASVLMASPLSCWRMLRSRQWRDLNEVWCCELIHISKYYWVVITFIIVYLPTFFMTIILVIILIQMEKFEAKLRRSRSNQSSSSLTINMKYRRRIVKVLILYLGISIVCWAPFQFSIIYRHFRKEACLPAGYSDFVFASQLLASVPGALNPFVFGFLSQPFRKIVSTFWMFKFLDKLLIWKGKPNSDNHQMEIQPGANNLNNNRHNQHHQHHNQPAIGANNNNNNNNQTTTRIRSGSTSNKRLTNTQQHHRPSGGRMQPHSSKQPESSAAAQANSRHQQQQQQTGSNQAQSNGIKTGRKHHHHHQCSHQRIKGGCDNAAYESTMGDDGPRQQHIDAQVEEEPHRLQIGTTSFIHHQRHHELQSERPLSPASVVSMDSINIEENLDGPNNLHLYQQQQQQQQQQQPQHLAARVT